MRLVRRIAGQNWLERGLLPLVVLLAEACWFYPWLVWLGKLPLFSGQRISLAPVSVIVLLVGAFLATRFFLGWRWRPACLGFGVVACGLVAVLLVLRLEYGAGYGILSGQWFGFIARNLLGLFSRGSFTYLQPVVVAIVVGVYLWWRGIRWGRSAYTFEEIYRAFVTGVVAQVFLGVLWVLSSVYHDLGSMLAAVGIWAAGFFLFGLASLALGNFQIIKQKMAGLEGAMSMFGRRWLGLLFIIVIGIVLLGVGLASLFSSDTAAVLGHWLGLAADGLLLIFYYLLVVPVSYLGTGLVYIGRYLVRLLGGGEFQPSSDNITENVTLPEQQDFAQELGLPPAVLLTLKWVMLVAVAVAVAYLLVRAVAKARSSRIKEEVEEIQESLWSWGAFREDLRLFWEALRFWFARKHRALVAVSPELPVYEEDEAIPDYQDVRIIYRRLLWEGAGAGITRRPGETPTEYAGRLGRAVPDGKEEMGYLTGLYQRVRYGGIAAPSGALAKANCLFRGLCQRLRALRKVASVQL